MHSLVSMARFLLHQELPTEKQVSPMLFRHRHILTRSGDRRSKGTVLLEVHVAEDGRFTKIAIRKSSGQPLFDDAAMRAAKQATRAQPAIQQGKPVESIELIPFVFQLKR